MTNSYGVGGVHGTRQTTPTRPHTHSSTHSTLSALRTRFIAIFPQILTKEGVPQARIWQENAKFPLPSKIKKFAQTEPTQEQDYRERILERTYATSIAAYGS